MSNNDSNQDTRFPVTRRRMIVGAGGTASLFAAGVLGGTAIQSPPSEITVEVSLFTSEIVADRAVEDGQERLHAAAITERLTQHMVPTLSTNETTVEVDVTIVEEEVPESVNEDGPSETLNSFKAYLEHRASNDQISTHSNLLLTDGSNLTGMLAGQGNIPNWDSPVRSMPRATFLSAPQLHDYELDEVELGLHVAGDRDLITPVHEIGHNLGFHHGDGYATTDDDWADEHARGDIPYYAEDWTDEDRAVYTTIMMNGYITSDYDGTENNFGEQLPEASMTSDTIATLPTFNPDLDATHLHNTRLRL